MKLTEEIKLCTGYHGMPGGRSQKYYSLNYGDVGDLIAKLFEQDIEIVPEMSEKSVRYFIGSKHKDVKVPLSTIFPEDVNEFAYILRDSSGLQLTISDYDKVTSSPRKGLIGGSSSGYWGVKCQLEYDGRDVDPNIVDKVKEVLDNEFHVLNKKGGTK